MRTFAIWFLGLIFSAGIGGLVGHYLIDHGIDAFAALTGMAVFSYVRVSRDLSKR
jgi:hypothetical protein